MILLDLQIYKPCEHLPERQERGNSMKVNDMLVGESVCSSSHKVKYDIIYRSRLLIKSVFCLFVFLFFFIFGYCDQTCNGNVVFTSAKSDCNWTRYYH